MIQEVTDRKFRRGQVWSYHSRLGEENSRITIVQVDCINGTQIVVHVTISNLAMRTPPYTILHAPFAEEVLAASVTKLTNNRPYLAGFDRYHERWRNDVENGYVCCYTILVQQLLTRYEDISDENIRMLSETIKPYHEHDYE